MRMKVINEQFLNFIEYRKIIDFPLSFRMLMALHSVNCRFSFKQIYWILRINYTQRNMLKFATISKFKFKFKLKISFASPKRQQRSNSISNPMRVRVCFFVSVSLRPGKILLFSIEFIFTVIQLPCHDDNFFFAFFPIGGLFYLSLSFFLFLRITIPPPASLLVVIVVVAVKNHLDSYSYTAGINYLYLTKTRYAQMFTEIQRVKNIFFSSMTMFVQSPHQKKIRKKWNKNCSNLVQPG